MLGNAQSLCCTLMLSLLYCSHPSYVSFLNSWDYKPGPACLPISRFVELSLKSFKYLFESLLFPFYVCVFTYMYVCLLHKCLVPAEPEEHAFSLKLHCQMAGLKSGCWELNSSPLKRKPVFSRENSHLSSPLLPF